MASDPRYLHPTIDTWQRKQFWTIAIGLPVLFGAMFSAMFFILGNGH